LRLASLTTLIGMVWACDSDPQIPIVPKKVNKGLVYAQGREALASKGITRLNWGLTPFVSSSTVGDQYQPTLSLVAGRLGLTITSQVGSNYADLEQRLLSGEIDVATMSPYAYVRAKAQNPDIHVFASHIAGGSETYGSYIVARDDSNIHTIDDTRGKRFAFVDERSSSGWLFPAARLLDADIHPVDDVDPRFLGSHKAVIEAVISGAADVGATYDGALAEGRGSIPGSDSLRIVARTKRIPFDAYVVRAGFPPTAKDALQVALGSVSTRDAVGREALAPLLGVNGFMSVSDSHYKIIRAVEIEVRAALSASGSSLPKPTPPTPTESSP